MSEHKTIPVTDASFADFVAKNKACLVDCWAAWCGPCTMLSPVIEQLAGENPQIAFGKLNVDENQKTAMKFGVMSIPTILYFKDGKLADRSVGALPKHMIEDHLARIK